jgi:DNA-binding transcriptional MerR regulator
LARPRATDSEEQLPTAGRIAALKDMGFGLADIRKILQNYDDRETFEARLAAKRSELQALADETQQRLRLLDTTMNRLRKDANMKYNVTLKTLPKRYVASVRQIIPCYAEESILWKTGTAV